MRALYSLEYNERGRILRGRHERDLLPHRAPSMRDPGAGWAKTMYHPAQCCARRSSTGQRAGQYSQLVGCSGGARGEFRRRSRHECARRIGQACLRASCSFRISLTVNGTITSRSCERRHRFLLLRRLSRGTSNAFSVSHVSSARRNVPRLPRLFWKQPLHDDG